RARRLHSGRGPRTMKGRPRTQGKRTALPSGSRPSMASEKTPPPAADYVAIALSPALIMALVGSLVFFLVEVLYVGDYPGRLLWILFFFVFAAVLIGRISIQAGSGRAALYGIALAIPTWLGLQLFVEYPDPTLAAFSWGINAALMGVTWWCAHKLTWDCTFLDENEDASGRGILQAAGLEKGARPGEEEPPEDDEEAAPAGWWERYKRYREQRKKKHTPGVW